MINTVRAVTFCLGLVLTTDALPNDGSKHTTNVHIVKNRLAIVRNGLTGTAVYESTSPLDAQHASTQSAILIVHGHLRNAHTYFKTAVRALSKSPRQEQVFLIAPQFLTPQDIQRNALGSDILRWTAQGWMAGDNAVGPAALGSFDVFDEILDKLNDRSRFPDLKEIVIAGHSGGGQVVQRYAILRHLPNADDSVPVRFVVANPSSYAYFDAWRPEPVNSADCPAYNTWKYGLDDLPSYASSKDASTLLHRYTQQDVTYLLGENDTDPNHPALDKSCAAQAQGPFRLARGLSYYSHLVEQQPDVVNRQRLLIVPGVGHSADGIFNSDAGQKALFGG
ncbi:alpha/beta hydrolase [Pseudomonas cremoricolorata]|uniref:Lipoprotein n=1 Tax=Pseudomonas cremoricolorata TaxID=157783 RepID=A0A089WP14_9PSED|nr:alpha/beta hydrolase [Pseudomonas cremoricolorata]AIR90316.1 hypothetical protein LK03_13870 [Pseudomonas cremoricolorata]